MILMGVIEQEKKPLSYTQPCQIVSLLSSHRTVKQEGTEPSDFRDIINSSTVSWIDYATTDLEHDLETKAAQVGFSNALVSSLKGDSCSAYEDLESELGIKLPAVKVKQFNVTMNPLIILVRENLIFTIHNVEVLRLRIFSRYAETFFKKISFESPIKDRLSIVLSRIIDENNNANFDHLRQIEEQGDELSKELMDTDIPPKRLGPHIYEMKHALIAYLSALWATVDVLNSIRYGDAELLTDDSKILQNYTILVTDVNQQISLAEHLSDVLASGLEVLQSIYNNQLQSLNNRMALVTAYLTILGTAALVPNTIATILSSSAFQMGPKDIGWYIVLLVGSTLIATFASYRWAKKRGLLPKIN
jgi:magnesium transporter